MAGFIRWMCGPGVIPWREAGSGYSGETVIGAMFLYGTGIKRDAVAAREWFEYGLARPGTQRGNALYMLGMMYFKGMARIRT